MPCTGCTVNFTIFKRKKACNVCLRFFCIDCYSSLEKKCSRCIVVFRHPKPLKEDLMKIKTKELIFYLHLMGVDFKNCVEKEELVELIMITAVKRPERPAMSPTGSSSHFDDFANLTKSVSNKCQNLLTTFSEKLNTENGKRNSRTTSPQTSSRVSTPKSEINIPFSPPHENNNNQPGTSKSFLTNPTETKDIHRQVNNNNETIFKSHEPSTDSSFSIISTNNHPRPILLRRNSDTNLLRRPQTLPLSNECGKCEKLKIKMRSKLIRISAKIDKIYEKNKDDIEIQVVKKLVKNEIDALSNDRSESSSSLASVSLRFPGPEDTELVDDSQNLQDLTTVNNDNIVNDILSDNNNVDNERILVCPMIIEVRQSPTSASSSAASEVPPTNNNQSRRFFTLEDVKSKEDFEDLSVKQLKEILSINRVNFKGCCEKNELKERALRLWNDHVSSLPIEKMPNEDLCKICFSSGVSCVFLECGHCCTCVDCGKILNECPVCRSYITRIVRVFKS